MFSLSIRRQALLSMCIRCRATTPRASRFARWGQRLCVRSLFGDVLIDHSEIAGEASTVTGFNVNIGATRLHGGAVSAGTAICAGVYDEAFTFYPGSACP